MPDIGGTIRTLFLETTSIKDVIGTRMFSDFLPQGSTLPAIVYDVIDTLAYEHLGGIANIARARVQIDSLADSRSAANSLADAVRIAFESYSGTIDDQYITSTSLVEGERYGVIRPEAGTDQRAQFVTILDFFVHYRTTTS